MKKKEIQKLINNKAVMTSVIVLILIAVFFVTFLLTNVVYRKINSDKNSTEKSSETVTETTTEKRNSDSESFVVSTTKNVEKNTHEETKNQSDPTSKAETTKPSYDYNFSGVLIDYSSDTSEWELICLNKNRRVDSSVEKTISLSKVAGTKVKMDSRAADAYNKMYKSAAKENIYLTPWSGYRSYSLQRYLFDEYVNEYIREGNSREQAELLASNRRNPPGSSEHNIGICMDIICAETSANFQNTKEYAWLCENAADYGFILRYPEDKTHITGVKFEPWHWRYVGVENAASIKASGLCLEEYLGLA